LDQPRPLFKNRLAQSVGDDIFTALTWTDQIETILAQKVPSIFSTTFYSIGKEAETKGAPDGRVSCRAGKIEMGQGPITSLAQMMAEELDVAYESVDMVMGDTDLCPWGAGTWGSLSTRV
jgi:CO/xanthine dehydrogenase Mo-binding subunit